MLRLMQEAGRGGGISFDQSTKGSLSLSHLWTILFPNSFGDFRKQFQDGLPGAFWEKCSYVGFLLVAAAPFAFLARNRRYVLLFSIVAIGSLAFAFGEDLPVYRIHYLLLPGFRIPSRLLAVFALAVAVLGALGLDALARRVRRGKTASIGAVAYSVAVAAFVLALVALQPASVLLRTWLQGRSWAG